MGLLRIDGLPATPLDASAAFHAEWLATAKTVAGNNPATMLVFAPADHTHRAWRLAAVQELARVAAPNRVNAVASDSATAIAAAAEYLAGADGVTGQHLVLDDVGAGAVVTSAP